LAGAVLAHQRMELAWGELEVDVVKCLDTGESLGDLLQFQYKLRH